MRSGSSATNWRTEWGAWRKRSPTAKQQAVTEATRQLEDRMKRLEEGIANARQQALVEAKRQQEQAMGELGARLVAPGKQPEPV
jgi:uncharacterized protein YdcH (DUF465 family)